MRVILAVDAIFPPLTGIGRYAAALARGLDASEDIEELRYFAHGHWVSDPLRAPHDTDETGPRVQKTPLGARLRARLAQNTLAVRAYTALVPLLARWRLQRSRKHIFHSPNFMLPPFSGPTVTTIHDLSTLLYPAWHPQARIALMDRALPDAVARADRVITPSAAVRDELLEHYAIAPERVRAIPMGVDPVYRPRTAPELNPVLDDLGLSRDGYVLCVATLEPRKNIDGLLDAYEALPRALRERYPLVLAGAPGWNSDALQARIRDLAERRVVRHLGYVPEAQLPLLYAGARLFAFPAHYEGFGLPVLEAMASGVPVVTSSVSSLPEVAGDAALLVAPGDGEALAAALARGLEDEVWRADAKQRGRERAAAHTWQRCIDATLDLYRELVP